MGLIIPVSLLVALVVVIAPLPAFVLDLLLAVNITISVVILLTALSIRQPLEFSAFPTVLLGTTLFRLVLNIATTRLILSRAAEDGATAAGGVVAAFSNFVSGGSPVVGLVLFLILVVVQFLVITQGAVRVSEVSARFMLDSLPGRQSVIDSDVNSGRISPAEADRRRQLLTEEADFHGSMDGASKFVRGDAAAGLIITAVNLIGGLSIGLLQHHMTLREAADVYSRLTIGDGLASQLPALLISIAAGLIVTRKSSDSNLPVEMIEQVIGHRTPMLLTGGLLMLLSTTGLPMLPLLLLGGGCIGLAYYTPGDPRTSRPATSSATATISQSDAMPPHLRSQAGSAPAAPAATSIPVPDVEMLTLELGVGLLRLVDVTRGGKLMEAISTLRHTVLEELGFIVPKILVRDAVELDPREYRIRLKEIPVAQGTAYHDALFAFDDGAADGDVNGIDTRHPVTDVAAKWIDPATAEEARRIGLRVLSPQQVITEHLHDVIRHHASELLTRAQLHGLIDQCRDFNRKLVDETIPQIVSVPRLHQVLRGLLAEQVPIRDLQAVIEALSFTPDTSLRRQIEAARQALARSICRRFRNARFELRAFVLAPGCESLLLERLDPIEERLRLSPEESCVLQSECQKLFGHSSDACQPLLLLTSAPMRAALGRLLSQWYPSVNVLSREELTRDTRLVVAGTIHLRVDAATTGSLKVTAVEEVAGE